MCNVKGDVGDVKQIQHLCVRVALMGNTSHLMENAKNVMNSV